MPKKEWTPEERAVQAERMRAIQQLRQETRKANELGMTEEEKEKKREEEKEVRRLEKEKEEQEKLEHGRKVLEEEIEKIPKGPVPLAIIDDVVSSEEKKKFESLVEDERVGMKIKNLETQIKEQQEQTLEMQNEKINKLQKIIEKPPDPKLEEMEKTIKHFEKLLKQQSEKMDKLVSIVSAVAESVPSAKVVSAEGRMGLPVVDITKGPPSSWRAVIDRVLGPDFQAEVLEASGGNFTLKVIVPKIFDRRRGEEASMSHYDHSAFPIRRASDISDVELWCKRMKETIQKLYPEFMK